MKIHLLLSTIALTFLSSAHAYDHEWVRQLKESGFGGLTYTLSVSPLPARYVFRAQTIPQSVDHVQGWPNLNNAMLADLRTLQKKGVIVGFTRTADPADRAWALVRSGEFGGREDLWPAVVLTPKANRQDVRHENQHLNDYAAKLEHEILQDLEVAGFSGRLEKLLWQFIWEARAFSYEYEVVTKTEEQERLIAYFDQRYTNESMVRLSTQSDKLKNEYAKIFDAHTREFGDSAFLKIVKMRLAKTCEGFLIRPTETRKGF